MARAADYNFVWAPIDRSIPFDEQKANAHVDALEGVDYGFQVLLTGWIDTVKDNFPCYRNQV